MTSRSDLPARRLARRRFLQLTGGGLAASAFLAACSSSNGTAQSPEPGTPTLQTTYIPNTARDGLPTPEPTPTATPTPAGPGLDEKIGQMVLAGFRGLRVDASDPIGQDLTERHLGAVILFDYDVPTDTSLRNIESPAQVQALTADLRGLADGTLLIATDEEGGKVARLDEDHGFPPTVSAAYLGSLGDPDVTYQYAAQMAQTLATAGINLNLAPVVDLNVNPESPAIGALDRSFSADPDVVTAQALAFIRAHHDNGVLTALKHFPGHGSALGDSHAGFVDVTDTWSEVELEPFANVIAAGQADTVMTAHVFNANLDPDYPATLSHATITGILREQLGFDGVVYSDDMQMGAIRDNFGYEEAVRLAIGAGVDIIAVGNNLQYDPGIIGQTLDIIRAAVDAGDISEARIDESYARIMALKGRLAA